MVFDAIIGEDGFAAALTRNADERRIIRDELEILVRLRVFDLALCAGIESIHQNDRVSVEQLRGICRKDTVIVILYPLCE